MDLFGLLSLTLLLVACRPITGRDYFKQQNPNADFLNHESSARVTPPKRDYIAPQFSTSTTPVPKNNQNEKQPNKVKDLVNFYDNKATGPNGPTKVPSYSSIVQGSNGQKLNEFKDQGPVKPITPSIPSSTFKPTPKPLSFSAVVAGSNKPMSPYTPGKHTTPLLPNPNVNNKNGNPTPSNFGFQNSRPHTYKPGASPPKPTAISPPKHAPNSPPKHTSNSPPKPTGALPSSIAQNQQNKNPQTSNSGGPTDAELKTLSEELLRKDSNNAVKHITINYQGKTTSQSKEDKATQPLVSIKKEAWDIPTIKKILPLLDNYERDTLVNEYVTPQERIEENDFMDAVMSTSVIRHLMTFFKDKGLVTPDPKQQRDFLKQLWFTLYSRGRGKISSSGFEHVFVSELKNSDISGLHNWIYFSREEAAGRINYLGHLKYTQLNDKGAVIKYHFNQQGVDKPVNSMFIGTSPELEIALYTLCFVTRADRDCTLKLAGHDVDIVTHTFRYRSKNLIGSAYPQI